MKSKKKKKFIVAQATSENISSISIIRISGEGVNFFIQPLINKKLLIQKLTYVKLYRLDKTFVENILAVYFKSPKSLTGEDIVEFHMHGNTYLSNELIKDLIKLGARMAKPGEFLERRYLNGKISLIECEMIHNRIFYNCKNMLKLIVEPQKNLYLCIIKNTKFRINMLIMCLENIFLLEKNSLKKDFIFIKNFLKKFIRLINFLILKINKIEYFKKEFEVVIIGRRNVGKSTFFNKMTLNYDSIITNIPGTTKNNIIKKINCFSKKIVLNDTAGLKKKTKNLVEKIGILRNINKIFKGDLFFYIVDKLNLKSIFFNIPINLFKKIKNKKLLLLINKCDLYNIKELICKINELYIIFLSAKYSNIIPKIKCFINKIIEKKNTFLNNELNLKNINLIIKKCNFSYKEFICSYDIILERIINLQKDILNLSGDYIDNITINSVFRNFCIGK